jgi:hypothetical protein
MTTEFFFTCDNKVVDLFKRILEYVCFPSYYTVPLQRPHLQLTFSYNSLYIQIYCPPLHQSNANKIRLPNTVLRAQKGKVFQFSAEKKEASSMLNFAFVLADRIRFQTYILHHMLPG